MMKVLYQNSYDAVHKFGFKRKFDISSPRELTAKNLIDRNSVPTESKRNRKQRKTPHTIVVRGKDTE